VLGCGESPKKAIRPDFNRSIMIDFQGAKITSDVGFLLVREIDDRFKIIDPMKDCLEDLRSPAHTKHAMVQMVRQRVYQIAAGYEDCNDADFLRIDPALRLALGKDHRLARIIHQNAKNLEAQAFQTVQKTLCFFGLSIILRDFKELSYISKTS
jgi:hypothetical protein